MLSNQNPKMASMIKKKKKITNKLKDYFKISILHKTNLRGKILFS